MKQQLSNGMKIAFDEYGPATVQTVVLIHGLSGNRETFNPLAHFLLETYGDQIRIINLDLRGHGDSSHGPVDQYNGPQFAADVAELLNHRNAGRALVLGHSLGGVVAHCLGANHRDTVHSLLLEDPPTYEGDAQRRAASPVASIFPKVVAAVRAMRAANLPIEDYEELASQFGPPDSPKDVVAERVRSLFRWDPETMQAALDGVTWQGLEPTVTLPVPVTVVRADPACGAVFTEADVAPFTAANPHAKIHMVSGATHGVHDAPTFDSFCSLVSEWLSTD